MTVLRVACALFLLLPVACSGTHQSKPPAPSVEKDEEDGNDAPAGGNPKDAKGFVERGDDYVERGEYDKAISDYKEAIRLAPEESEAYNSLAWLLATCTEDRVRDGKKAVELATKACELTKWKDADTVSTLAAAEAECGHFDEAVKWQKKALKIGFDDAEDTKAAREQLKLYEAGKPYREK
jgi:cytochrome c-type biogenesis protein CcmH/NrfG